MELRRANDSSGGPPVVFLPGIIMPAVQRYSPLIEQLDGDVQAFTKELEVYDDASSNGDAYSIDAEVAGLARAVDAAGLERFFLYGHSAGGAIALAFAAARADRLLGLGLDEPATDFAEETKAAWAGHLDPIVALPAEQRMPSFMRAQVGPGVELPPPPPGPPPDWMASRPAGIDDFARAMTDYRLEGRRLSAFSKPVYFSFGSRTNPVWRAICERLAAVFPNFTAEEYDGLHHLNTSHAAEPKRVADALRRVWSL
jgi:pimeloyl-ACP methyl ester carboxylesterase